MDVSDYTKKMPSGACIGIGSLIYWHARPAEHGETRNITAQNMTSRGRHAVSMSRTLSHSKFSNIKTYGDNRNGVGIDGKCSFEDVSFEHLWYGALQQEIYAGKMLTPEEYRGTVIHLPNAAGDINFRDVNADQVRCGICVSGDVKVIVDGFHCNNLLTKLDVSAESTLILNEEEC